MTGLASESSVELIWNKGLAAECDRRLPDEFPNGYYETVPAFAGALISAKLPENLIANPETFADVQDGELIWIRLSWLKSFVKQALPEIKSRFVLATGDSDNSVPSELGAEVRTLLESPQLVHWFAQNHDGSADSARMSPLPIGIDFHSLAEKPCWGENATSPVQQERVLRSVLSELAPLKDRPAKVYVDFAWQRSFGFFHYRRYHPLHGTKFQESRRKIAGKMARNDAVFCQTGPLPRTEMWRQRGRYAFVLSPHGMGLDCHRTWEALALGHIVLAPSSSLNSLYTGLAVVPLKSWEEITPANLQAWLRVHSQGSEAERLKTSYWIRRMKGSLESMDVRRKGSSLL